MTVISPITHDCPSRASDSVSTCVCSESTSLSTLQVQHMPARFHSLSFPLIHRTSSPLILDLISQYLQRLSISPHMSSWELAIVVTLTSTALGNLAEVAL